MQQAVAGPMRDDRGVTLIESLMAIALLGIASAGILTGWTTVVSSSARHQKQATVSALSTSAAESILSPAQAYVPCAVPASYNAALTGLTVPTGFTVAIQSINYWNGTTFTSTCLDVTGGTFARLQQISVQAASPGAEVVRSVTVVKRGI